jgi:hypothetical protein
VRDAVLWSIPILWPLDLAMLPMRGPRPTLKEESRLTLKIMDDLAIPSMQQTLPMQDPYGLTHRPPSAYNEAPPPMQDQPAPQTYADAAPPDESPMDQQPPDQYAYAAPPPVYAYPPAIIAPPPIVYGYGGGYGGYVGPRASAGFGFGGGYARRMYPPRGYASAPRGYANGGAPRAYGYGGAVRGYGYGAPRQAAQSYARGGAGYGGGAGMMARGGGGYGGGSRGGGGGGRR